MRTASNREKLKEYVSRRKFGKTPEPEPGGGAPKGMHPRFVVHKHAARALHYDLRLELGGVFKSWAVPKGPSMDPSEKRLAVMVEDHPLEYGDFEGVIPEGNYGAGSVIVWDRGTYRHPLARDGGESEKLLREGLEKGNMKLELHGEKLKGEFALVRMGKDGRSWLLMKKMDPYAGGGDILADNRSVSSGKTLEEIAETDPAAKPPGAVRKSWLIRLGEAMESPDLKEAPAGPMPRGVRPMLASLAKGPFDHPDWIFEVKWDGYRAVAEVGKGEVSLYSRNLISLKERFAPVAASLRKFGFEAVLDGEIVVVDDGGRPDFQMLQNYRKTRRGVLVYRVFDLIHLEGRDLTGLPLLRRKAILQRILPSVPNVMYSDHVREKGVLFFNAARDQGLEGIMAKHSRSIYLPGRRSNRWLKVKTRLTQEAVIAGFTRPRGGRKYLGALVLGVFEKGGLAYIGHAGGGLGAGLLRELSGKLHPLVRKRSPFSVKPGTNTPVTWVKPELVCEVAFAGWTDEGLMRQPVFLRLREDKVAREAVREKPASGG